MAPCNGFDVRQPYDALSRLNTSRFSFQQLVYLDALVAERHVTRAAEKMGIGQPAMSAALGRLREVFHDALLVKTSGGMEPTERARELIRRFREFSDVLDGQTVGDAFDPATADTRFRILCSEGIARPVLPELMALAGTAAPKVRFVVAPGDHRRLGEYLRDGDVDLGLAFWRDPPAELRQTLLYPQRLVCIARKGHPMLDGPLTLERFTAQSHVTWGAHPVPHATMEAMVDEALAAHGCERNVALRVSSIMLLPDIVARSNLVAVVSERLARSSSQADLLAVAPLPIDVPSVNISMYWHERQHHDAGHRWLRETLRDIGQRIGRAGANGEF